MVGPEFALLRDPRLAATLADRATSALPAWLWSGDGTRIVWANAVGAALFEAAHTRQCTARRFQPTHPAAQEIIRLAATLPAAGQARLERLRGFGAGFGCALTCICSRLLLRSGAAVLVAATVPAGPTLSLRERVRRLFCEEDGPLAVLAPDGAVLYATAAAHGRLGEWTAPPDSGAAGLAARAPAEGSPDPTGDDAPPTVTRLGSGATAVLVLTWPPIFRQTRTADGAALQTASAPAASAGPPAAAAESLPEPAAQRGHPLHFVWQMDTDSRVVIGTDELVDPMGPRTAAALGPWSEVARIDQSARTRRERVAGLLAAAKGDGARAASAAAALPRATAAEAFGLSPAAAPEAMAAEDASQVVEDLPPVAPAGIANVVAFPAGMPPDARAPGLSPIERSAFRELAQELTARLRAAHEPAGREGDSRSGEDPAAVSIAALTPAPTAGEGGVADGRTAESAQADAARGAALPLLDQIPIGVLIFRDDALLYANRHFLELSGYRSLDALAAAGGHAALLGEPALAFAAGGCGQSLAIATAGGARRTVEARLHAVPWGAVSAHALVLSDRQAEEQRQAAAQALRAAENEIRALTDKLERFAHSEEEMRSATRKADQAAAAKTEFLAKVSHEIRTPLNAMIGFTEVIMAEHFGPIGNERYGAYLKDVHAAGMHLVALLNDLLDLSKVETGQMELAFANVSLNDLTKQCVRIMQPQASRARIIIRTALAPALPHVVADERSLRQIVLNLLSNSIRLTGPGGQVIVSTAFADDGEAVLRVRDTGAGMSDKEIEASLEPFRQIATSGSFDPGGSGLGLPLTKALTEANRARFSITSAPNAGTLVEVAFPPARVVAQ